MPDNNDVIVITNVSNPGQPIMPGDTFRADASASIAQLSGNKALYLYALTYPQGWQPGEPHDVPWGDTQDVPKNDTFADFILGVGGIFNNPDPVDVGDICVVYLKYKRGSADSLGMGTFRVGG